LRRYANCIINAAVNNERLEELLSRASVGFEITFPKTPLKIKSNEVNNDVQMSMALLDGLWDDDLIEVPLVGFFKKSGEEWTNILSDKTASTAQALGEISTWSAEKSAEFLRATGSTTPINTRTERDRRIAAGQYRLKNTGERQPVDALAREFLGMNPVSASSSTPADVAEPSK